MTSQLIAVLVGSQDQSDFFLLHRLLRLKALEQRFGQTNTDKWYLKMCLGWNHCVLDLGKRLQHRKV